MKTICYIHGAQASYKSFNFIKSKFPNHNIIDITYTTAVPLEENLDNCIKEVEKIKKDISIIGHSLGGILGLGLSQLSNNVDKLVTLSTPFGGSKMADTLRWWYPSIQLFDDISTLSPILKEVRYRGAKKPTLSFITTEGRSPLFHEPNDGVVSVSSQISLPGSNYVQVPLNHFEILLCEDVALKIKEFIWDKK